jgi:hypothetical protein
LSGWKAPDNLAQLDTQSPRVPMIPEVRDISGNCDVPLDRRCDMDDNHATAIRAGAVSLVIEHEQAAWQADGR